MTDKFIRKKNLVERLVQRLRIDVGEYDNPKASGVETGADVMVVCRGRRIGVQVTILDTGPVRGKSIAGRKEARQ